MEQAVSMNSALTVENLDHLGNVAGLLDALGIVEAVNQHVGEDPREQVSPGIVVKAMILNGLGFVSAPLYLFQEFFVGKATEHLLGPGILAAHLNDERLGRVCDQLYTSGLSDLFVMIALRAVQTFGLDCRSMHLEATSFAVAGEYLTPEPLIDSQTLVPIRVIHGYCRDHRPDLKQFVMNLVCWSNGDIPAWLELADGHQADKTRFAELMQAFRRQWHFDGLYVADAALYSEANRQSLSGLQWLTRVPLTLKSAVEVVSQLPATALQPTGLVGYIGSVCTDYGGGATAMVRGGKSSP